MAKLTFPIDKITSRFENPDERRINTEPAELELSITNSELEEVRIGEESYLIKREDFKTISRALGL